MSHFFLIAFKVLSLSFEGLIVIYLGILVWLSFEFILIGVHWVHSLSLEFVELLWCLYLCLSSNLKFFSHYFFKYSLYPIFFFFGASRSAYVSLLNYVSRCLRLCSLFYNLFSFYSSDLRISIVQSLVYWFFLWSAPICFWIFLCVCSGSFLLKLIYFLLKDNCFTEFCCFLSKLYMNQP